MPRYSKKVKKSKKQKSKRHQRVNKSKKNTKHGGVALSQLLFKPKQQQQQQQQQRVEQQKQQQQQQEQQRLEQQRIKEQQEQEERNKTNLIGTLSSYRQIEQRYKIICAGDTGVSEIKTIKLGTPVVSEETYVDIGESIGEITINSQTINVIKTPAISSSKNQNPIYYFFIKDSNANSNTSFAKYQYDETKNDEIPLNECSIYSVDSEGNTFKDFDGVTSYKKSFQPLINTNDANDFLKKDEKRT